MAQSDGWKNLRPANKENAVERGRLGGLKSGQTKKERRTMKEMLQYLLGLPDDEIAGITTQEAILVSMIRQAKNGSVRAAEFLRDLSGEKPVASENNKVSGKVVVSWAGDDAGKTLDAINLAREALPEVV